MLKIKFWMGVLMDPIEKTEGVGKVVLKAGQKCSVCTCGSSKNLPYCDGSHRTVNGEKGTSYKSLKIWPQEDIVLELFSKNWKMEKQ